MTRIMIQVSPETKQQLDDLREACGVPTAAWVRRLIERELTDPRAPEPLAVAGPMPTEEKTAA